MVIYKYLGSLTSGMINQVYLKHYKTCPQPAKFSLTVKMSTNSECLRFYWNSLATLKQIALRSSRYCLFPFVRGKSSGMARIKAWLLFTSEVVWVSFENLVLFDWLMDDF